MAIDLRKAVENAIFCASGTKDDRPCKSCWENLKQTFGPLHNSDECDCKTHVNQVCDICQGVAKKGPGKDRELPQNENTQCHYAYDGGRRCGCGRVKPQDEGAK